MVSGLQKFVFFAISVLCCYSRDVAALKVSVDVPDKVFQGQSTALTCNYDLGQEILYSIKWYKDHVEFYRYIPNGWPEKNFFPVRGVNVDIERSNNNTVFINDIGPSAAGMYACEVSSEAPYYRTAMAEKRMSVKSLERKTAGQFSAHQSAVSVLIVTILSILVCKYHMW